MNGIYPVGVIVDALAVAAGGALGALLGRRISEEFREKLNAVFGVCSMAMGIASVVLMKNLPAVIFSVIAGTVFGILGKLETRLECFGIRMRDKLSASSGSTDWTAGLVTAAVLFCASGTGIYGSIVSGISGDQSILLAKAILDFFTAMIFACSLGWAVSWIALPQALIFLLLFFLSTVIMPSTDAEMIADFKACGGILMVATGFRILKLKMFPVTDMLPAMVIVMPLSALWTSFVLPFLS